MAQYELLDVLEAPSPELTKELNELINEKLSGHSQQEKAFWLFQLATSRYHMIDNPDYDIMDYQLAAEYIDKQVSKDVETEFE